MKLDITSERVLAAAEKCGTARSVLRELFPEAFKQIYPLNAGDVYKSNEGCNDFMLIQAVYESKYGNAKNEPVWCLLGAILGIAPNSNSFHEKLHNLTEITEYLEKNKMVFSHNKRHS